MIERKYTRADLEDILEYPVMERILDTLYPMFQHYGWTWGDKVPTRDEIEETIYQLTGNMLERGDDYTSSGRICINRLGDTIEVSLELGEFYLEQD